MDFARSGIEVLAEVMPALRARGLDKRLEVLVDGGVRRGGDVLKAVALGATGVGIGRPSLYGMASYGQDGVEKVRQCVRVRLLLRSCTTFAFKRDVISTHEGSNTHTLGTRASCPLSLCAFVLVQHRSPLRLKCQSLWSTQSSSTVQSPPSLST